MRGPAGDPSCTRTRYVRSNCHTFVCTLGDAQRGPKVAKIRANYPVFREGSIRRAHRRTPEESDTPARALGTTIHTYHVGLKQPPPRRLCPGRYTQRVKVDEIRANYPASGGGSTHRTLYQRPKAFVTRFGALETTLHTYQVRLKKPPDRRLCPWRYMQGVKFWKSHTRIRRRRPRRRR